MIKNIENACDDVGFAHAVKARFDFLNALGFVEIESLPTLVRYRKGDVEVDVYHGRQSYELGAGITRHGNRYSLSDLIRATNNELAEQYRNPTASRPAVLGDVLDQVALMQRYGAPALQDDPSVFTVVARERKRWSQRYSLEVLAQQLRPIADEAFHSGKYAEAAQLFKQIQPMLTAAEQKNWQLRKRVAEAVRNNWQIIGASSTGK